MSVYVEPLSNAMAIYARRVSEGNAERERERHSLDSRLTSYSGRSWGCDRGSSRAEVSVTSWSIIVKKLLKLPSVINR